MLSFLLLLLIGTLIKWAGCAILAWAAGMRARNVSCVPVPLPAGAVPMRYDSRRKGFCRGCGALPGVWCLEGCRAA